MAAVCPDHHDLVHRLQRSLLLFFGQLFTLTKAGVVVMCFYITGASRSSHLCIASIYRVRHLECTQFRQLLCFAYILAWRPFCLTLL